MTITAAEMGRKGQEARRQRIGREVDARWPGLDPATRLQRIDELYHQEQVAIGRKGGYVRKANRLRNSAAA